MFSTKKLLLVKKGTVFLYIYDMITLFSASKNSYNLGFQQLLQYMLIYVTLTANQD